MSALSMGERVTGHRLMPFGAGALFWASCSIACTAIAAPKQEFALRQAASSSAAMAPSASAKGAVTPEKDSEPPKTASPRALTFGPEYLPKEVVLSKAQVEAIREAVAKQMTAYHWSLSEQNRVAGEKHALWLKDAIRSFEYDEWNRTHIKNVLLDHTFYSKTIFWAVIVMVLMSLLLTVYQFMRDSANADRVLRKLLRRAPAPEPSPPHEDAATLNAKVAVAAVAASSDPTATALAIFQALRAEQKLSLGPSGLQLGTQLVGLVVLGFSMGFFYLYLDRVYPVTVAQPSPLSVAAAASSAQR